jgi:hypothetical protein
MPDIAHRHVFVCGLHRSGTSLITRCLMQHPQVSGFKDTGAIEDEGQFLQTVLPLEIEHGGVGRFGFDPRARMTEDSVLNTPQNARTLLSQWRRNWDMTKPVLIEKTPGNLLRMRLLAQLVPQSHFVIVTRHPVAACMATMKWTEGNLFSLLNHWVHCYRMARADAAGLGNVTWVSYEAFVGNTEAELGRLLRFTGLAPDAAPALRSENEKYFALWRAICDDGNRAIRQVPPEHYRSILTRIRERIARARHERTLPAARRKANLAVQYDALDAACLFEPDVNAFGYSFQDLNRVPQL